MGSRLRLGLPVAILSLPFLVASCGGAADTDLLGTPPDGNGDAAADVTTPKDAARDNNVPDAMPPPPVDAAPDVLPPPTSAIACGGAVNPPKKCDAVTELCCRTGVSSAYVYGCIADPKDCLNSGDVPFTCSNDQNCVAQGLVGNVCCASIIGNGNGGTVAYDVSCAPKASCYGGNQKLIVCNPQAPTPCPNGGSCKLSSQTLNGYYICF